jgi:tRNA nucleotidyltransferase (CCA-adding enzyme)
VVIMVRWHMFFSDTEQISLSAVRRMIVNVGRENIWDLMNVRVCDRIGTGRPKEDPYRLRKYHAMIEEALRDPITVGMLKIDGRRLIEITQSTPAEYLEKRSTELYNMEEGELKKLGEQGKQLKKEVDQQEISKIRKEHKVK